MYASENSTERAITHFLGELPHLTESTVRKFKKMQLEKPRDKRKQIHSQSLNFVYNQGDDHQYYLTWMQN